MSRVQVGIRSASPTRSFAVAFVTVLPWQAAAIERDGLRCYFLAPGITCTETVGCRLRPRKRSRLAK
jgi:hypothetical protein